MCDCPAILRPARRGEVSTRSPESPLGPQHTKDRQAKTNEAKRHPGAVILVIRGDLKHYGFVHKKGPGHGAGLGRRVDCLDAGTHPLCISFRPAKFPSTVRPGRVVVARVCTCLPRAATGMSFPALASYATFPATWVVGSMVRWRLRGERDR